MENLSWVKKLRILEDIENIGKLKDLSWFAENLLVSAIRKFGKERGLEVFIWLYEEYTRIAPFKERDVYVLKVQFIKENYGGEKISEFRQRLPFNCSNDFIYSVLNTKEIFSQINGDRG